MEKQTALYETHVKYGGKMVPFAGYILPVQYGTGVIAEHMAVRTACGLFDVSHMGEILCDGEGALDCLNHLMTNDFTGMPDGKARYSPMCNEEGGVVDDLIVHKIRENHYLIVVNASNKDKDYRWMKEHETQGAVFTDISEMAGQIALQGPGAKAVLEKLAVPELIPSGYYSFASSLMVAGIPCFVSRTGYTGEDGYELYTAASQTPALWEALMEAGQGGGLIPCGLGARDTLRLEAAMPLYGHEMDDVITPLETGLGFAVKMGKEDFIGKAALTEKGEPESTRVGIRVTGRGIIREHEELYADGVRIGVSTSGTHAPYLGYPVAMALVKKEYKEPGTKVSAVVRGREIEAEVVPLPFYKRAK